MTVSPDFVTQHSAAAAWLLGISGVAAAGIGAWAFRKLVQLYSLAQHCFTNCVPTIQDNTGKTHDAVVELKTSMDTYSSNVALLASVIEKKL